MSLRVVRKHPFVGCDVIAALPPSREYLSADGGVVIPIYANLFGPAKSVWSSDQKMGNGKRFFDPVSVRPLPARIDSDPCGGAMPFVLAVGPCVCGSREGSLTEATNVERTDVIPLALQKLPCPYYQISQCFELAAPHHHLIITRSLGGYDCERIQRRWRGGRGLVTANHLESLGGAVLPQGSLASPVQE